MNVERLCPKPPNGNKDSQNTIDSPSKRRFLRKSLHTIIAVGAVGLGLTFDPGRSLERIEAVANYLENIGAEGPESNLETFQPPDLPLTTNPMVTARLINKLQNVRGAKLYTPFLCDEYGTQLDVLRIKQISFSPDPYFLGVSQDHGSVRLSDSKDLKKWSPVNKLLNKHSSNPDLYEVNGHYILAFEQSSLINGTHFLGTNIGIKYYKSLKDLKVGRADSTFYIPRPDDPITLTEGTPNIEKVKFTENGDIKITMRCHNGKLDGLRIRDYQAYMELELPYEQLHNFDVNFNPRILRRTLDKRLNEALQKQGAYKIGQRSLFQYAGKTDKLEIYCVLEANLTAGIDGNDYDTFGFWLVAGSDFVQLYIITPDGDESIGNPDISEVELNGKRYLAVTGYSFRKVDTRKNHGPFFYLVEQ